MSAGLWAALAVSTVEIAIPSGSLAQTSTSDLTNLPTLSTPASSASKLPAVMIEPSLQSGAQPNRSLSDAYMLGGGGGALAMQLLSIFLMCRNIAVASRYRQMVR